MTKRLMTVFLASLVLMPAAASAQEGMEEEYHKNIKVYQVKPVLMKNRVEVGAFASASTNPGMMGHVGFGGSVEYHLDELNSVGLRFTQFMTFRTDFRNEVEEVFGLFPERSQLGWGALARYSVTPLFGKFGVSFLPYWNASAFVGAGVLRTAASSIVPAGEVGVELRFFLTKGLAFTVELSDTVYREVFKFDGREEPAILQNWMVSAGVSLYVPYSFSYTEVE